MTINWWMLTLYGKDRIQINAAASCCLVRCKKQGVERELLFGKAATGHVGVPTDGFLINTYDVPQLLHKKQNYHQDKAQN